MRLFSKWRDRYIKEPIAEQAAGFMDKGQYNLAIRVLEKGLDIDPDYPSFLWLRAEVAMQVNDWSGALACYEELEEVLGEHTPAHLFEARGAIYFRQKAYAPAAAAYVKATEKGLNEKNILFRKGISHLRIQHFDLALQDFQQVEQEDPDYPGLGLYLAETFFFLKKYQTATAYFRRASQQKELTAEQFEMLADAYLYMKAYKKAAIVLTASFQKTPPNARKLVNRAYCYLQLDRLEEALDDLNQAISFEKGNTTAFAHRGYVKLMKGNIEAGKKDIDQAMNLDPSLNWIHRNLAYYHILQHEPETALRQLEKAFIIDGETPLLNYFKGLALLQMDEIAEAQKALQAAADRGEKVALEKLKEIGG